LQARLRDAATTAVLGDPTGEEVLEQV